MGHAGWLGLSGMGVAPSSASPPPARVSSLFSCPVFLHSPHLVGRAQALTSVLPPLWLPIIWAPWSKALSSPKRQFPEKLSGDEMSEGELLGTACGLRAWSVAACCHCWWRWTELDAQRRL